MKSYNITTNRGQFHYKEYGQNSNPKLVLVHGYPQSSRCWQEVAVLLEKDFHIIAVDLRGHGDSNRDPKKELYIKSELAKDVISMLDKIGISDFCLAGHDWGGAVVQEMVFQIPKRISKLMLLNFPIINNPLGQMKAYEKLGQKLFAPFWYQFFLGAKNLAEAFIVGREEIWLDYMVYGFTNPIPDDARTEYLRCMKIPGTIKAQANLYRTMRDDFKSWSSESRSKKMAVDALIIHGALDRVILTEYYEGKEKCFQTVDLHLIESGHFVMDEKPVEVAEAMREFLG